MNICKHCLGKGKIIINAGTGLLAACVKCAIPKPDKPTIDDVTVIRYK